MNLPKSTLEQSPLHSDKSGLSQVFEDNRSALLRFLTARTRDPSQAEDLLQDVWIKIDTHTQSGPIDNPLGYLFKMCENVVRDAKRSEVRKLARETLWSESQSDIFAQRGDQLTPEKIALERDQLKHALLELEKLPDRTRQIFIDFRLNEITQKEIAANLDISISAVEKHLQRAYRVVMDYRKKDDAGLNRP
ncbi:sigma-70 family RNA polymerase sigma factor [Parasphingorhabdus sp.]|uniref:RNA polymerase sigma factor n=1 Tax=Parasphingorhabdus sp. TaxID=2709688 RepID=UPI00326782AA